MHTEHVLGPEPAARTAESGPDAHFVFEVVTVIATAVLGGSRAWIVPLQQNSQTRAEPQYFFQDYYCYYSLRPQSHTPTIYLKTKQFYIQQQQNPRQPLKITQKSNSGFSKITPNFTTLKCKN